MSKKDNNLISVVSQAYYGNKVGTEVNVDKVDNFILGYLHDFPIEEPIDRTIVKVPNTENIVIVYNKYKEEKKRDIKANEYHDLKPTAVIPEINFELYSRCIVCRMNDNGELESLQDGDFEKFEQYLAD